MFSYFCPRSANEPLLIHHNKLNHLRINSVNAIKIEVNGLDILKFAQALIPEKELELLTKIQENIKE